MSALRWLVCLSLLLNLDVSSASAHDSAPPADTIFLGGTILTVAPSIPEAEAMAVKDGKILQVGSRAQIEKWKGEKTRLVDLKGRTLLPGFIEPHGHPFAAAIAQFYAVDVRPFTVKNAAQLNAAILQAVNKAKPGEYVFLNGIDPVLQSGVQAPTLKQMDAWAPNNPFVLIANSGHAAYGNSLAFKAAGITAATPAPPGTVIVKGPDGQLTGTVEEFPAIVALTDPILKSLTPAKLVELMRTYYAYMQSHGITAMSDMSFNPISLPVYQALEKDPLPPPRLRLYEMARKDNQGTLPPGGGDDLVRQNGIKWWADGSPWQGTIAVSKPFLTDETTTKLLGLKPNTKGSLNYSDTAQLQQWVENYYQKGYQIAVHAEGDVAIDQFLDVLEATMKKYPRTDSRPRIQHAPLISQSQLERAKRMGVQVSFLMTHVYYWGDLLPKMVGVERAANWNPTAWAEQAGIPFSFHNDGPVTPADPLLDFQVAALRKTQGSGQVLGPEQRISVDSAIRARTLNAAHEIMMEKEVGSLEEGKLANLVILSADPRKQRPEEIGQIKVESTYINGKQVYPSPGQVAQWP